MNPLNGVVLQTFQWNTPEDPPLWARLRDEAAALAEAGFTAVWLPPPGKGASGVGDVGYGVYDLYDLGEFNQKKTVRTRYGTREQLDHAVAALHDAGLQVYLDVVMNHRLGADATEEVDGTFFELGDREQMKADARGVPAWSRFEFRNRRPTHSDFVWRAEHFTVVPADGPDENGDTAILLLHKGFAEDVSTESHGNGDYLMGCDVDFRHADVRDELHRWGKWLLDTTHADGVRLDAVKHISAAFVRAWTGALREHRGGDVPMIAEYWSGDVVALHSYLSMADEELMLFDVPLHYRLHEASKKGRDYDLRTIFEHTLVADAPTRAVTFVDNHDTEPDQSLASWVDPWFKPIAYALVLLREGGYPCVFAGDLDGLRNGEGKTVDAGPAMSDVIHRLMRLRREHGDGPQRDHFEKPTCIAWSRGDADGSSGGDGVHLVVVCSTADADAIHVPTGRPNQRFRDALRDDADPVTTHDDGGADFPAPAGGVAVWVPA